MFVAFRPSFDVDIINQDSEQIVLKGFLRRVNEQKLASRDFDTRKSRHAIETFQFLNRTTSPIGQYQELWLFLLNHGISVCSLYQSFDKVNSKVARSYLNMKWMNL